MVIRNIILALCICLALLTFSGSAWGTFMRPDDTIPMDRLIENLKRYVQEHPDDASGYGQLARASSLAFAYGDKMKEIGVYNVSGDKAAPRFEDHGNTKPNVAYRKPGKATPKELGYLLDRVKCSECPSRRLSQCKHPD